MAPANILNKLPGIRIVEGHNRLIDSFLLHLGILLRCGRSKTLTRFGCQNILIKSVQQIPSQFLCRKPYRLPECFPLSRRHLTIQPDDPAGKSGQCVSIPCSQSHAHHQFFQTDGGLALQSTCLCFHRLCDPYCVHNDEMVLVFRCRGRHLLQIILIQHPGSPTLHLLEIVFAAHIPHENQAFNRLYIRSGGNHIHRNCDSGIIPIPEFTENLLRILGRVSNFLAKLISFAKFFPDDLYDIICMAVRLRKNQSFRHLFPPWEKRSEEAFLKRTDDRPNLAGIDNIPIQLRRAVVHILIQLGPAFLPGHPIAVFYHLLEDCAALLANLRLNQEDILTHIDAINNRLLPGIFADNVLVKKTKGSLIRSGCQSNQEGIKVLQDLLPHIVNGSVALVNDNHVKKFRRILGIVHHFLGSHFINRWRLIEGVLFCGFIQLFSTENRVHPLDGADTHLHIGRDKRGFQPPDTVQF